MFTEYSTYEIEQESLDYLIEVEKQSSQRADGLYLRQFPIRIPARFLHFTLLCIGLGLLTLAGYQALLGERWADSIAEGGAIAGLIGLGLTFLATSFVLLSRPIKRPPLGCFWWIDGRYFWRADGARLFVKDISEIRDVRCYVENSNGSFRSADLMIQTRDRKEYFRIEAEYDAKQVTRFLAVLVTLRNLEDNDGNRIAIEPDELLGPVAKKVMNSDGSDQSLGNVLDDVELGARIPNKILAERRENALDREECLEQPVQARPILMSAAIVALLCWLTLPFIFNYQKEYRLYKTTISIDQPVDYAKFLKAYPRGYFAVDIQKRYEQLLFARCESSSECEAEPYREYLRAFPSGERSAEVGKAFEEKLYNCAMAAGAGEAEPYEEYLKLSPPGPRSTEIAEKYENNIYAAAILGGEDYEARGNAYLTRFPEGKHVKEIQTLLDDRFFESCVKTSQQATSPEALRNYLSDKKQNRHEEEARSLLAKMYADAIRGLRERFDHLQATVDQADKSSDQGSESSVAAALRVSEEESEANRREILDAMVFLLETLQTSETPNVSVRFNSTENLVSEGDIAKIESLQIEQYLAAYPQLKSLVNAKGTAIVDLGEAFSEDQKHRRESLITDRVEAAVRRVIGPGFVKFVSEFTESAAVLDVSYKVYPSGAIYIGSKSSRDPFQYFKGNAGKTYTGLVRGYDLDWSFVVKAKESDESKEFGFESSPASELSYEERPGDPDWAPYALLMHSSFYDMSNRLIGGFGIPPSPLPRGHRFDEATGIETFSVEVLAAAVEGLLRNQQVLEVVSEQDQKEFRRLIKQLNIGNASEPAINEDLRASDSPESTVAPMERTVLAPSDIRRKIEEILDRYPGVNAAAMQIIQRRLDAEAAKADPLKMLPFGF
jgi:hypothetical protein